MRYFMKNIVLLVLALLYAWMPYKPVTFGAENSAREVIERVENAPRPADQQLTMTMTLVNSQGQTLTRTLEVKKQGDDKSYLLFVDPPDVKNTAFLNISHELRDDEMYLYLPALNRIRRIASSSKHKNFMGSDFTYDDMGDRDIDDYTYRMVESSTRFRDQEVYLIEGSAKDPNQTGYSKLRFWIRKDIYQPVKIEFFDRHGDLEKVQTNAGFKRIGEYLLATRIEMQNVQTGHKTILELQDIQVDQHLPEMTWTRRNLAR